ncbi:MAG: autotransporter-associated beta strand repeat-containing protein [Chthoniobacteraceae bacterium]
MADIAWPNTVADIAFFTGTPALPGAVTTVTLGAGGVTANGLGFFKDGYLLTGAILTLGGTTPTIEVSLGNTATISSVVAGSSGLTVTGGGALRLTNASNSYTGDTIIRDGIVIINNNAALGVGTTTVVVTTPANPFFVTRGYGGGSLVLEGGYSSGVNLSRNISVGGLGPINDRGTSLISVGANDLSGLVSAGIGLSTTGFVNTRIVSTAGTMKFSGTLNIGGQLPTNLSNTTTFGQINATGAGQYEITGVLQGNGILVKEGAGTLVLNPSNASGFAGSLRMNASSTGTQGTVRISSSSVLGTRGTAGGAPAPAGVTTQSVLDFNGGFLEIRTDTPNFTTTNIFARGNTSNLFVDHAVGTTGVSSINGTVAMGKFYSDNTTFQIAGRNGWNTSFQGSGETSTPPFLPTQPTPFVIVPTDWTWTQAGNATISNNSSGMLTLDFNVQHILETTLPTVQRTFVVGGNGDVILTGNVKKTSGTINITIGGTAVPTFVTSDPSLARGTATVLPTGQLTMAYSGPVANPSAGTTTINSGTLSFASSNALPTGAINIGNATTTAGTLTYTGAGETLPNTINLNSTSAQAYIIASGTGALTISNPVIAVTGSKTIILGGTSAANNTINSVIPSAGGTLSVQKFGSGTWVLSPTSSNLWTGSTTISGGTLRVQERAGNFAILSSSGPFIFTAQSFTNAAAGTLDYLGASGSAGTEIVGPLTASAGAGTVSVSGTGGGTAVLTFNSLGTRTAGATLDFRPALGGSIRFTAASNTNGILGGFATFNGTEFVANVAAGGTLAALTSQIALPTSGGTATVNYKSTANTTTTTAVSSNSLKIVGAQTITLGGLLTVTSGGVLFDNGSGAAAITGNQIGASGSELIVTVNGSVPGNALTISSLVSGTTGQLTKAGSGTLILTGANAFTGNVHINGGILRLSGVTARLGSAQVGGTVLNVRQDGTLDLFGAGAPTALYSGGPSVAVVQTGTLVGAGTITNTGGTPSALLIGNGTTTTASGLFTGILTNGASALNVVKNGTGTQSLTGLSTYTGATIVTSGTLAVTSLANGGVASSIGASTNVAANLVFNGGTLLYTGSNATIQQATQTPSVSTDRLFTLAANGTIDSSGQYGNNVLAAGSRNDAALVFSNTGNVAFAGTGTRTLTLQGNSIGDNQMNVRLVDNGAAAMALTKAGAGLWILSPATSNNYSGSTTISGGALQVAPASALVQGLSAASNLVFNGGVLETSGTFARAAGALGNQVQWSGGTANGGFSASTGKLIVNLGGAGGALTYGSGAFTSGSLILSSTTALAEVEFRNGLDLNGGTRTIQVDDNVNTASDFATVSGVISNSSGSAGNFSKTGGGMLQLLGPNTYNGTTNLTGGTLVVTSLGNSATASGTSIGTSTGANTAARALTVGNGGGGAAILQYVGMGETSNRMIRLNTTTGSNQIHADGSGALVLTNVVNDMAAGNKTLFLRGSNAQANQITSNLSDNGGTLGITVDGGATWVLAGANSFTGVVSVNAGALGIGNSGAIGDTTPLTGGRLLLNSGSTFAYGADRTIANTVQHGSGQTTAFIGDYSLNFTGTTQLLGAGNYVTTNTIANSTNGVARSLSHNTVTADQLTGVATWTINGTGDTRINGPIQNSVGTLNLTFNPSNPASTLTLAGVSTYNGATNLQNGRVILAGNTNEHLPSTTPLTFGLINTTNSGVLQLGDSTGPSNQTLSALAVTGTGPGNAIVGGNAAVSTLRLDTTLDQSVPFAIGGPGTNENNLKLVKTGSATLTLGFTNTYTGGTDVGVPDGIDGGRLLLDGFGTLGSVIAAPAVLNVYGGIADIGVTEQDISDLNLGRGAAGSTARVVVNGDLFVHGNITYDATNNPSPATISGNGGLDLEPSASSTTITVGSSTAGSGGALAPDLTISASITGIKDIRKAGPGTLRLVANTITPSTWQKGLFVDAGTLILDGSTRADGVTPNTVLAQATQITVGTGSVAGKLDFGAADGETTVFNRLTVNNNSTLVFNLGAVNQYATPGLPLDFGNEIAIHSDFLYVSDTNGLTLGTGLKIDINALSGFGLGRYVLIEEPSSTDFAIPFTLGTRPGGFSYTLGKNFDAGSSIYDIYLDVGPLQSTFYWKGGQTGGTLSNWSSTAFGPSSNWVDAASGGTLINGVPGLVNDVIFSASSPSNSANTVVDINLGVKSLTISDASVVSIKGVSGTVLSVAEGITINSPVSSVALGASAGANALFLGVVNTQNWTNNGTGTLTIWNQVFSQGTTGVQILTFNGSGPTIINGNIIDGGLGGSLSVAKTSASTLTLNNAGNTYKGGTKIGLGTLQFASGALPNVGVVEFTGNATLQWLAGNTNDISGRLRINDGRTATLDIGSNNVNFASVIQNLSPTSGALTKTGPGTLTFAANNTGNGYGGGTNINQGTVVFVSGGISAPGNVTFTGNSTLRWGTTTQPINTDDLSSRLRFNTGVTGALNTNGNDLIFNSPFPTSAGSLTKDGNGTLTLAANNAGVGYSGGTNINQGALEFVSGGIPAGGNVIFTGTSTLRWGTGVTNDLSSRLNITSGVTATLDTNGNDVVFANPIQGGGASTGNITKTGGGTLTFAASNPNFQGATLVDEGTLAVAGSLSGTTSLTVSSGATFGLVGTGPGRINSMAPVAMGAGAAGIPATLLVNSTGENLGALTLAGDTVIDFGIFDSNAQLKFANSSAAAWTGALSIYNWTGSIGAGAGADQLFFGTNASGLMAGQLARISFYSDGGLDLLGAASFASFGEVVPVPEPSSLLMLVGGAATLLGVRRRRTAPNFR